MAKSEKYNLFKCVTIGKVWYGIAITIFQIYVHYDAIWNYMDYKQQSNDPRYGLQWNEAPSVFYLMMILLSLATLPLYLYSSLLRTGNLVNDYDVLGESDLSKFTKPHSLILERLQKAVTQTKQISCSRILKYYCMPSCQALHYVSSFLLLIPQMFLNSERIKNSAISFDYLWISDLHTIFSIRDPGTLTIVRQESEALGFPIATINFFVATVFLASHTSSVFWRTTKSFSVLVAIFDLVSGLGLLVLLSTISVAIKYYSVVETASINSELYSQSQCASLLFGGMLCILLSRNLIFEFGLQRFMVNQRAFNQLMKEIRVPTISTGLLRNSREFKDRIRSQLQSFWINTMGFVVWLVSAGFLIPVACYLVRVYWNTGKLFFIFGFVAVISNILTCFTIWMLLSIKHNWIFNIKSTIPTIRIEEPDTDPLYSRFNGNKPPSQVSFSKLENDDNGYMEDKSDLYQLFRMPPEYHVNRIPSVTSIPSNVGNDPVYPTYQTIQRQNNPGLTLNGIDENRALENYTERLRSPYGQLMVPQLLKMQPTNASEGDSAYQSYKMKNYSQDSLRSMTFGNLRKQLNDFSDPNRVTTHSPQSNFESVSHSEIYPTKDNVVDDNTDISTDFSDVNTWSDGRLKSLSKYGPIPPYHKVSGHSDRDNEEIFYQQTGV